jgi:hypothetical protein
MKIFLEKITERILAILSEVCLKIYFKNSKESLQPKSARESNWRRQERQQQISIGTSEKPKFLEHFIPWIYQSPLDFSIF